jgi:flagellar basal body-associated protein FliL
MGIVIGIGLFLLAGGGIAVAFESSRTHALQAQAAEAQAAAQAADAAARARQTEALIIAIENSQRMTTLLMFVVILLTVALLAMIAVWLYTNMRNREQAGTFHHQPEPLTAQMWAYYMMLRQKLGGHEYEFPVSPANTIVTADDPFWMLGVHKDEEAY